MRVLAAIALVCAAQLLKGAVLTWTYAARPVSGKPGPADFPTAPQTLDWTPAMKFPLSVQRP